MLVLEEFRRLKRAILGSFSSVRAHGTYEHHLQSDSNERRTCPEQARQNSFGQPAAIISNPVHESFQHAGILVASSNTERNASLAYTRSFILPRGCEREDETTAQRKPYSCQALNDSPRESQSFSIGGSGSHLTHVIRSGGYRKKSSGGSVVRRPTRSRCC